MNFSSCSSVNLMDEIMDMMSQIKDESTPNTRDPNRVFFFMMCLCVKLRFSIQNQTDMSNSRMKVRFRKYARWIEKLVFSVHRPTQQKSPLDKELRNSMIIFENSLEDSDNPLAVTGETLCRADEAGRFLYKDRSKRTISLPIRRKKKQPKRSKNMKWCGTQWFYVEM
eukprot:147630_1